MNNSSSKLKSSVLFAFSIAFFTLVAFATPTTTTTTAKVQSGPPKLEADISKQAAGDYVLDKAHASVTWRVAHMGLSQYTARFDKIDGKMNFTPATASASRVEFTIDATSINTGLAPFNKKLQGAEYFDAEKNANITFKSNKVEFVSGNKYKMSGDMTLRGVTKPMVWDVTFNGGLYNPYAQAQAVGFSVKGLVKRSDWGMTELIGVVGDNVEVLVEVEFLHRSNAAK